MWRPWNEDDRPVWAVRCEIDASLDEPDQALLLKTVNETGLVRATALVNDLTPRVVAAMLVRAESREVAEYVVSRLVEVASVAAGLPSPGIVRCAAVAHEPGRQPRY